MAELSEIIEEINALAGHCRPPIMSMEQRARWAVDWAEDLAQYPMEAIAGAFRDWRNGDNGRFPTAGQILPMIRAKTPRSSGAAERPAPWSHDLSDGDYRAMSLSEKIRHHTISALHCRKAAGPMPFKPAINQDQMPAAWHGWRRRGENHEAEVKRLREFLTSPINLPAV